MRVVREKQAEAHQERGLRVPEFDVALFVGGLHVQLRQVVPGKQAPLKSPSARHKLELRQQALTHPAVKMSFFTPDVMMTPRTLESCSSASSDAGRRRRQVCS